MKRKPKCIEENPFHAFEPNRVGNDGATGHAGGMIRYEAHCTRCGLNVVTESRPPFKSPGVTTYSWGMA